MLAELLTMEKSPLSSYHEHESLLENIEEETLTEEERKAAWEEYEQEKKGIINRAPAGLYRADTPLSPFYLPIHFQ